MISRHPAIWLYELPREAWSGETWRPIGPGWSSAKIEAHSSGAEIHLLLAGIHSTALDGGCESTL